MSKTENYWISREGPLFVDTTELEGPYECPLCGGHLMLDCTFIDQVSDTVTCPYCNRRVRVPEDLGGQ